MLRQISQRGIHVVLATARVPTSVQSFYRLLGINGPMICVNGAQVWASPEGPVWVCHTIPRETAQAIARLADEHNWELSITVDSITYWRQRPGQELGQAVNLQATTSCNGSYSFGGLRQGDYTVSEVVPRLWKSTSPAAVNTALGSGQDAAFNFFNRLMTLFEMLRAR